MARQARSNASLLPSCARLVPLTGLSGQDTKESPAARHTLEMVLVTILELEARTGDKVDNGARDQHLTRASKAGDTLADVDGNATDVIPHHLDLTGVKTGTDL
jgi:hypothetical protein